MTAILNRVVHVFAALCPRCGHDYQTANWPGRCPKCGAPGNESGGAGE